MYKDKTAKAAPGFTSFLGKRTHSGVTGGSGIGVPPKRQRVSMTSPSDGMLNGTTPDTWVLRTKVGGNEMIILSSEQPKFYGINGHDALYQVSSNDPIIRVPIGHNTGWYQQKDIIWTNN